MNASSSLGPLDLKWMVWGDIDERKGPRQIATHQTNGMWKRAYHLYPQALATLPSLQPHFPIHLPIHSLSHSFHTEYRLIHGETTFTLLCHWLSEETSRNLPQPPPPPPGLLPFLSDTKGLEQPESWNPFQKVTFPAVGILKTFWKTRNSTSPPRDQAHHPPADLHTPECPCLHPLDLWGYSLCRVAFPPVSTFLGPNTGHKASTKSYPLRWYEDSKLLQQKSLLEVPAGNANPRDPRVSN